MGNSRAGLHCPAATRQLREVFVQRCDIRQMDVTAHDDVRTRFRPGLHRLVIAVNAVVHFAVAQYVHWLMRYDDPELVTLGFAQLSSYSLDLLVRDFTVLVPRRARGVQAGQLESIALQLRLEHRAEDSREACVRKEQSCDDIEERDIVIARDNQAIRDAELVDEAFRGCELRAPRPLRDVA